jgi:hypothetical protein
MALSSKRSRQKKQSRRTEKENLNNNRLELKTKPPKTDRHPKHSSPIS